MFLLLQGYSRYLTLIIMALNYLILEKICFGVDRDRIELHFENIFKMYRVSQKNQSCTFLDNF